MTARDIMATTIDAHDLGGDLTCQCGWAPPDHSCPVDPTHQCAQQDIAAWERHRADAVAAALRVAGLLPPDGARTLRDDLESYVNDIRRQLPYLAPGGPREMAEQIAYDLQTLLDAQPATEETP